MHATQRMLAAMDEDRSGQVAVLFLSERTGEDPEGYAATPARMEAPAALQPGYRGADRLSAGAAGITIRRRADAASAGAGRGRGYRPSRLHVATIDRSHGWTRP